MKLVTPRKRTLSELGYPVAKGVLRTIQLLEERYGASEYHDSGHTQTAPTWIFKFPKYANAEVGVRMNKRDTTLYIRDKTCDGKWMRDLVSSELVKKVYPRDGQPANSIRISSYLGPSASNEVLMLELGLDDVEPVLSAFFNNSDGLNDSATSTDTVQSKESINLIRRRALTEEDFAGLLERRTETGRAGEMAVILDELARLRVCGCPCPENYVKRVAESDVGLGYDVETTWPGEERCIEVKTTAGVGNDFFLSANERDVLAALGSKAWLYRVEMKSSTEAKIVARINDPMKALSEESMKPVVWRVSMRSLGD